MNPKYEFYKSVLNLYKSRRILSRNDIRYIKRKLNSFYGKKETNSKS